MVTSLEQSRLHVLDEELFRHILVAERRRADRSSRPLVVVRIGPETPFRGSDAPQIWRDANAAVAAAARNTDVVGWLQRRASIGVLLGDVSSMENDAATALRGRVEHQLRTHLPADVAARFSLNIHVHHEPSTGEPCAQPPIPIPFRQVRKTRRRQVVYDSLKRLFDIAGSASLLAVLTPVFLLIAALIKLRSPGPVLFRQERIGRNLKPFKMLKFRTMHVNADPALHCEYVRQFMQSKNPAVDCARDGVFKLVNDPRVTSVGRVLRQTSLDEIPQFWNVLRGEMSLVGPRPPLPYEVEQYKHWHTRRVLEAKPGITGLWQVGGRSRTSFDDMVRLDLRYARTQSFWTDLKILLATPGAVFTGKGAC